MLQEVYKYGDDGKYIEPVMVEVDENGEYELPENCTDKKLPQPNIEPFFDKELDKWVELTPENEMQILLGNSLQNWKKMKENELDLICEETILGRFKVVLNENTYEFSYDDKAQSRFNGTASLFNAGKLTEIPWTAYLDGERQRIKLDQESFFKVALAALSHCNENVVKFNNLLVQVNEAASLDELKQIVW